MSVFCTNCGKEMSEESRFCPNCGASQTLESDLPGYTAMQNAQGFTGTPHYGVRQNEKRFGNIPRAALIGTIAALALAAVGAVFIIFFIMRGKGEGSGSFGKNTTNNTANESIRGDAGGQPGNILGAGGEASNIKVPEGYQIKKDTAFLELVGEYEGEIRMSRLQGFEKMEGAPANIKEELDKLIGEPIECRLEIDDEGAWVIGWPLLGNRMDFNSKDIANPKDFTPAEMAELRITGVTEGGYRTGTDKFIEDKEVGSGSMYIKHIGVYCTGSDDNIIAGNLQMRAEMQGIKVELEGDFVVHKTTEDLLESAGKENGGEDSAQSAETENTQETDAVTGGTWTQVASVWFYEKDGSLVRSSWILDQGKYYYVDESGYMLRNAYTPDNYYVGDDGSYDPNAPENQSGRDTQYGNEPENEALEAIASRLSTDERAYEGEFDWFVDYVEGGGQGKGQVLSGAQATQIKDLQAALNGGWKAYTFNESGTYGSEMERFFNAFVEAQDGKFNITMNYRYVRMPGESELSEDNGNDIFHGTYDETAGTATAQSAYAKVDFEAFYLSKDGMTEYAIGRFYWISGEEDRIALMRSAQNR